MTPLEKQDGRNRILDWSLASGLGGGFGYGAVEYLSRAAGGGAPYDLAYNTAAGLICAYAAYMVFKDTIYG